MDPFSPWLHAKRCFFAINFFPPPPPPPPTHTHIFFCASHCDPNLATISCPVCFACVRWLKSCLLCSSYFRRLWPFSHESKVCNLNDHSNDGFYTKLHRDVDKITSQFKWWSRGVFQRRISQITQQNCRMNALTSTCKLWFGGRSYVTI